MDIAILLFDGFEDLDVFGPFDVLQRAGLKAELLTAEPAGSVTSASGAQVTPHGTLGETPRWIVVPGGGWAAGADSGVRAELLRGSIPAAISRYAEQGSKVASVCTGALLVGAAGLLENRSATTHHSAFEELARYGALVVRDARVVDGGDIVSAGGVTSGIDLGLWLVRREMGASVMRAQERRLEHRLGRVRCRDDEHTRVQEPVGEMPSPQTWFPTTSLAQKAYEFAKQLLSPSLFNHSVRSYLFARLVAGWRGMQRDADFDDELVFLSCVLHDVGLADAGQSAVRERFEVVGASRAAHFLAGEGLTAPFADVVADAIALHSSFSIADRHSPEAAITRAGISMDFGGGAEKVSDDIATAIHRDYPRLDMARCLMDAIVAQAGDSLEAAPPYSLPGEVVRERREAPFVTRLEQRAAASRWGS